MDNKVKNPNFFKKNPDSNSIKQSDAIVLSEINVEETISETSETKASVNTNTKASDKNKQAEKKQRYNNKSNGLKHKKAKNNNNVVDNTKTELTKPNIVPIRINQYIISTINEIASQFNSLGKDSLAKELEKICKDAVREKFTISVVGEFSRGKSTFINNLIGKDILPVGNLPTTAMLTKIRYNKKEMIVYFDNKGQKKGVFPLSMDSWDGLTANNITGQDPQGTVFVMVDSKWLGISNFEIIDTPGAGDLEEKRVRQLGEALISSDAAIITISAAQALSLSEKLFIEQRLITNNTPYLMLIITKLDTLKPSERVDVIEYIKKKLDFWKAKNPQLWKTDIPVFIPQNIEMPTNEYDDIMGIDNIKKQLNIWQNDTKRTLLTERWIISRVVSIIDTAIFAMKEQKILISADDEKRINLIKQKKDSLIKAETEWERLRIEMRKRSNNCYNILLDKVDECTLSITERLQYEVSHSNDISKWWKEDYPYRLKSELANTSVIIENTVSKIIASDMRWFSSSIEKTFKTNVLFDSEIIADKSVFKNSAKIDDMEIENLDSKRNFMRVGITVASLAGALLFMSSGFFPTIATMGVGTGGSILSEKIFKDKIQQQRNSVKEAIAKNIPQVMKNATSESEQRITAVYEDILKESKKQEEAWMQAQNDAIENANKPKTSEAEKKLEENIDLLENYKTKLLALQK